MPEIGWILGGRYQLLAVLGRGGMATIYRAYDSKLGREVAVKVLRPEYGTDAEFVARFRHEAQAAAALTHPNIVSVYDYGTDPAGPYIVMELVPGGDLAAVVRDRGALPPTAVARTGQQVADALAAAHARGIVHRDIKPSNILLAADGRVEVADFGIAQAVAGSSMTAPGVTMGSVHYFSPEQARGESATAASDIYSLGLVLYEGLTGQRAFTGDSPASVAVARLASSVPSPAAVRPDVPPQLDAIVRWCLNPDPAARPSAVDLSAALGRYLADPNGTAAYGVAPAYGVTPSSAAMVAPTTVLVATEEPDEEPESGGSGPWAWVAALLGLVVIAAAGVLLFVLFTGIGGAEPTPTPSLEPTAQVVDTPRFTDLLIDEAEMVAAEAGLLLEQNLKPTTRDREGIVLDQLPEEGAPVALGSTVRVDVGTRRQTVVVPELRGLSEDDAILELEDAGLRPGTRVVVSDAGVPRGYVAGSDPRAGVAVVEGERVDYFVSRGRGGAKSPRPTASALESATPKPTRRPTPLPTGPGATATPDGRTPVPEPTPEPTAEPTPEPTAEPTPEPTAEPTPEPTPEVTPSPSVEPSVSPSVSPEVVLVGNYACLDLATARMQIEENGLLLGTVNPEDPPPGDDWLVAGQLPGAGEEVPPGSAVDLVVIDPTQPCPPA